MMTSKYVGPDDGEADEPKTESPTLPGIRKPRLTTSAVTLRELPAALDTIPLPSTRGAGFRAPEEGGSDRPFEMMRARDVNPHAPTMPLPASQKSGPRRNEKPSGKSTPAANKRKR
jgi:hypothetical protein